MRMAGAADAGLLRRLWALALDAALAATAFGLANLVLYKLGAGDGADLGQRVNALLTLWQRPQAGVPAALALAAAAVCGWRFLGGTPGGLLAGITVRRSRDGAYPGVLRSVCRLAVAVATGGIGLLFAAGGRRALYDRITGTRAVIEDEALVELAGLGTRRP